MEIDVDIGWFHIASVAFGSDSDSRESPTAAAARDI